MCITMSSVICSLLFSMILDTANSQVAIATFTAPEDVALGQLSTVTVSAHTSGGRDGGNFLVFRLTAEPKVVRTLLHGFGNHCRHSLHFSMMVPYKG